MANRCHSTQGLAGKGHGTHGRHGRPIWGQEYKVKAGACCVGVPCNPEAFVSGRTLALSEYLSKLQVK